MRSVIFGLLSFSLFLPVLNASAQSAPSVDAYLQNAEGTPAQTNIPPSPVDLLFDADSYVPPFYLGRALPSAGTSMHLQALAHFVRKSGASVPDSEIIYTWRRNGQVESSVSGAGKSSISLLSPTLFGTDTISLDARTADGAAYGSASITVTSLDPDVTLYQDHPLFGIEYYYALESQTAIPDLEMTFVGVPYFAQTQNPSDPRLIYAWSVNGESTGATTTNSGGGGTNGNEITINADNSSGFAALSLVLTSPANLLLHAEDSWKLLFSREGLGAQSIPGSATSGGIFHTGAGQ
jgi:hypothetical protein